MKLQPIQIHHFIDIGKGSMDARKFQFLAQVKASIPR